MKFKVAVLRHGKAAVGEQDQFRILDELGIRQAKATRIKANTVLDLNFDKVISSPANRATFTAEVVGGGRGRSVIKEELLYPIGDNDPRYVAFGKAFGELGYAPLSAYLAHSVGNSLMEVAQEAVDALIQHFKDGGNYLIAGHAIISPAILFLLAEGSPDIQELCLNQSMAEASILWADLTTGDSGYIDQDVLI